MIKAKPTAASGVRTGRITVIKIHDEILPIYHGFRPIYINKGDTICYYF
ncbi:hypothetical protein FHT21_001612 [Pedobacter sp. SG908]|nr:hypothetical protein [Pedobacter sp. SG908]